MSDADLFWALGNERRLQILRWVRNPVAQFLPQRDGDLVEDGVCGQFITDKLGVSASTLSEHMRVLQASALVTAKRIRQWTFFRRNDEKLATIASIGSTI
ncbi:helix-turn-helix transcriptional regulator [Sphingomonas sp. S6]|jgi:DNA-binding transcriptional ArsR family regulator|uniref:ArsR/SmtB family transcription factor n=1 Tax=Sphingomonas sp. S6 TaxID=3368600 RepID=UPI000FB26E5C|nr:helix-turn-helix transcriptional regulator [uncultured Sphingomonas sp.]RTL14701.1 MAG: transcriptional regulator [Sphingomonadaceae bacterium]